MDWRLPGRLVLDEAALVRLLMDWRDVRPARELGLLLFGSRLGGRLFCGSRVGLICGMPNESRLDGRSWPGVKADESRLDGRSAGVWTEEALLPPVRFLLLRRVTVAGMYDWPRAEPLRGEE